MTAFFTFSLAVCVQRNKRTMCNGNQWKESHCGPFKKNYQTSKNYLCWKDDLSKLWVDFKYILGHILAYLIKYLIQPCWYTYIFIILNTLSSLWNRLNTQYSVRQRHKHILYRFKVKAWRSVILPPVRKVCVYQNIQNK